MRATRYPNGVQAVRIEAYVHPDTAEGLRERSNGLPLGVLLDRLIGRVPDPLAGASIPSPPQFTEEITSGRTIQGALEYRGPAGPAYELPAKNTPVRQHIWVDSGPFGKICKACKRPKKVAEGTNCVPIDENPPEEAHLTQKGPK